MDDVSFVVMNAMGSLINLARLKKFSRRQIRCFPGYHRASHAVFLWRFASDNLQQYDEKYLYLKLLFRIELKSKVDVSILQH